MIVEEILELANLIAKWVNNGLRTDEIVARINDPEGVAQYLLERAQKRRAAGAEYLGRGGSNEGE